jgi:hypothetical protein
MAEKVAPVKRTGHEFSSRFAPRINVSGIVLTSFSYVCVFDSLVVLLGRT